MRVRLAIVFLSLTLIGTLSSVAHADSWAMPKKKTFCSTNNKFCLKVLPKKLTSQLDYFQDKVDEKNNAGVDKESRNNKCRGIFYTRDANGILRKRWEIDLVNEVAPVDVLVSDQGDYVITFDNWHSVGYGDDVVAIYSTSNGKRIRNFGLSEFLTDNDIDSLPRSISSIWWGNSHFIDRANRQLILQVTKGKRAFQKDGEYFQIRVDLSNGKVLDEKRDRFPSLQFKMEMSDELHNSNEVVLTALSQACVNNDGVDHIDITELTKRIKSKTLPSYPPAARAVRAQGIVNIAIKVNQDGSVACAEGITGHPLLTPVLLNSVKNWTFANAETSYSGYLSFKGSWFLAAPDGSIIEDK